MKDRLWFGPILIFTIFLLYLPLISHTTIWNQDPWAHEYFYKKIVEEGISAFQDPFVQATSLHYFPIYHLIMASFMSVTGMAYWSVYRTVFILLPGLSLFLTYILATRLFDRRTGLISALVLTTLVFFHMQSYYIGLTYNMLLQVFVLGAFITLTDESGGERPLTGLFLVLIAFTHVFGLLYLIVFWEVLRKKDRGLAVLAGVLALYPIYTVFDATGNGGMAVVTDVRNTLGQMIGYLTSFGPLALGNALFQVILLGGGIYYFTKKDFWKAGFNDAGEEGDGFSSRILATWTLWIMGAWVIISLLYGRSGAGLTLLETDRFMYYLSFPAAISGGVVIREYLRGNVPQRNAVAAILFVIFFLYPVLDYSFEVSTSKTPMEESLPGLMFLEEATDPLDIVITSQTTWTNAIVGVSGQSFHILKDGRDQDILTMGPDAFSRWVPTEDALFQGIVATWDEVRPSYIFLSIYEINKAPHVAEWFRVAKDRFEVVYDDGRSMVIRINQCSGGQAFEITRPILGLDTVDIQALDLFSVDALPKTPGNETWVVVYELKNGSIAGFFVNKQTCNIKGPEYVIKP